jgi:hypothetical protein
MDLLTSEKISGAINVTCRKLPLIVEENNTADHFHEVGFSVEQIVLVSRCHTSKPEG